MCKRFDRAVEDISQAGPNDTTTLDAVKEEIRSAQDISDVPEGIDIAPLRNAMTFIASSADRSEFSSVEWQNLWGAADRVCVNVGAYPVEKRSGG